MLQHAETHLNEVCYVRDDSSLRFTTPSSLNHFLSLKFEHVLFWNTFPLFGSLVINLVFTCSCSFLVILYLLLNLVFVLKHISMNTPKWASPDVALLLLYITKMSLLTCRYDFVGSLDSLATRSFNVEWCNRRSMSSKSHGKTNQPMSLIHLLTLFALATNTLDSPKPSSLFIFYLPSPVLVRIKNPYNFTHLQIIHGFSSSQSASEKGCIPALSQPWANANNTIKNQQRGSFRIFYFQKLQVSSHSFSVIKLIVIRPK